MSSYHNERCPRCGNYAMNPVSEKQNSFSAGKAVVGGIILGPIGLLAGALGSRRVILSCDKCGYTVEK